MILAQGRGRKKEKFFFLSFSPSPQGKSRFRTFPQLSVFPHFPVFQHSLGEIAFFFFCHLFLNSGLAAHFFLFLCRLSVSPSVFLKRGEVFFRKIKGKRERKRNEWEDFFSVHRTVLFPPSPQEKSGEKRRGRGRKMKKGKVEKKPPDILSAREKRMGGKK